MVFNNISDWCKWLEKNFSPEVMIPTLPVIIRLDGNNFSKWTKNLKKPFDEKLTELMIETTKFLVKETNAVIGYTQSDEITLILYSGNRKSLVYNDGKKQKILSKLTGKCVTFFNNNRKILLPEHNIDANFDCRIYQVPTLQDACVQLLWRENDATRNSIQMVGHSVFSDNEMFGLNTSIIQDKLMIDKNINWNDFEPRFKRGTYIRRTKVKRPFTTEELNKLPAKHNARIKPDLLMERVVINEIETPIFNKITNKIDFVFNGADPILENN